MTFLIAEQVHIAGALDTDGVQTCTRCGYVLTDYRSAMVPESDADKPLRGWAEGAHVEVIEGFPKYSGLTDAPANCLYTTGHKYNDPNPEEE